MQVVMEVRRDDGQYRGTLTRVSDQQRVEFVGVLELVAALERLDPDERVRTDAERGGQA